MTTPSFVYAIHIATTPEKLWEALTKPEFTRQYWAGRAVSSSWRKGDRLVMTTASGGPDFEGEILEVDPPRRLVFGFHIRHVEEMRAEGPSRVTYEIEAQGVTTRLTVTHDGFPEASKVYDGIRNGWPAILSGLKTLLETGQPMNHAWGECG